jgi:hypothetical protein
MYNSIHNKKEFIQGFSFTNLQMEGHVKRLVDYRFQCIFN